MSLNANRHVTGVLRGFDQFMNIVLDNAVDEKAKTDIGMVVSLFHQISQSSQNNASCCGNNGSYCGNRSKTYAHSAVNAY